MTVSDLLLSLQEASAALAIISRRSDPSRGLTGRAAVEALADVHTLALEAMQSLRRRSNLTTPPDGRLPSGHDQATH